MARKCSVDFQEARYKLFDVFATDPRPTLLIDVSSNTIITRGVHLEFANDAFQDQYGVLLRFIISGQILEPDFIEWLNAPVPKSDSYILGDLSWSFFILDKRWKIVNVAPARGRDHARATSKRSVSASRQNHDFITTPSITVEDTTPGASPQPTGGSGFVVALPSGLVSLGNAPTALEGLHRSVDMLDVGFFEYGVEGTLIFANKSWYALSGHPMAPRAHTELRFLDLCFPEDKEVVTQAWMQLLQGKPITFEMRWKHMGTPAAEQLGCQWVLAACNPLFDENGQLTSITGCTTDINAQKLSIQNAQSRAEALERARTFEERFIRFASVAPIVIFTLDAKSRMTYCNSRYAELTGTPMRDFEDINIGDGFFDEDATKLLQLIQDAAKTKEVNSLEMRVKRSWHGSDGKKAQAWVLASIFAEFTNDGVFQGCTGTLVDISGFKYAETLQQARLEDALEAKRQQENFIDMTSHEMRNPLSAMMQCADSALAAVSELGHLIKADTAGKDIPFQVEALDQARLIEEVELANEGLTTILSCCAHQKCIIDDVLTLSKLDSNLLSITPVRVQPVRVMQEVIKMFEMDAIRAQVQLEMEVSESIAQLGVESLMMDPSRVKQILINLVGNAIKFTRTEANRKVILTMGAFLRAPTSTESGVTYAPASRTMRADFLSESEWGRGDVVFLQFHVRDTGRGLDQKEQEKLFHRFSQANPKTHVEYGGSGLGLFISRQLTEMQGGMIGVASEKASGSTFAFYIQTRRAFTLSGSRSSSVASTSSSTSMVSPLSNHMRLLHTDSTSSGREDKTMVMESTRTPPPSPRRGTSQPNILVVEDNMVNQRVLCAQLRRAGCKVFVANHGVEALDFLQTTCLWHHRRNSRTETWCQRVDIILMDVEMPVMGGLECTRTIRQFEAQGQIRRPQPSDESYSPKQHYRLPIISISANARAEQNDEQREAGIDDFVTKPFRIPQVMEKIRRLLGRD